MGSSLLSELNTTLNLIISLVLSLKMLQNCRKRFEDVETKVNSQVDSTLFEDFSAKSYASHRSGIKFLSFIGWLRGLPAIKFVCRQYYQISKSQWVNG